MKFSQFRGFLKKHLKLIITVAVFCIIAITATVIGILYSKSNRTQETNFISETTDKMLVSQGKKEIIDETTEEVTITESEGIEETLTALDEEGELNPDGNDKNIINSSEVKSDSKGEDNNKSDHNKNEKGTTTGRQEPTTPEPTAPRSTTAESTTPPPTTPAVHGSNGVITDTLVINYKTGPKAVPTNITELNAITGRSNNGMWLKSNNNKINLDVINIGLILDQTTISQVESYFGKAQSYYNEDGAKSLFYNYKNTDIYLRFGFLESNGYKFSILCIGTSELVGM